MIHIGPAGVFGAPSRRKPPAEPDADCFRPGDVWLNSRGTEFRVTRVQARTAHMVNTATGRTHARPWDAIGAHSGRPWTRVSCGVSAPADESHTKEV